MTAMFNHDWFHGDPFSVQQEEARWQCTSAHFPDVPRDELADHEDATRFCAELEIRILIYLRDGFSYEVKQVLDAATKSHLLFECEPVEDQYKVGAFVVSLPFDEVVRVEVFAVHPSEKPDDLPQITGFRAQPDGPEHAPKKR
ncbi:MAG: hypothetical protein ACE5E6_07630 [Phycisphaerae bacterium]